MDFRSHFPAIVAFYRTHRRMPNYREIMHLAPFHFTNAALRSQIVPCGAAQPTDTADGAGERYAASPWARLSWAQLLKRVFALDLTACPQCGDALTILAAIDDSAVIIKILMHLGLPSRLHHGPQPGSTDSC